MSNPICCGVESHRVTLSPAISYLYCRECKKEVEDSDLLARSASMSDQEAGDYLDRVLRDSAGQPITLEELDKGSVFLAAKQALQDERPSFEEECRNAVETGRVEIDRTGAIEKRKGFSSEAVRVRASRIFELDPNVKVSSLIDMLQQLPPDATVSDWRRDWDRLDCLEFKARHESFERHAPGALIPRQRLHALARCVR